MELLDNKGNTHVSFFSMLGWSVQAIYVYSLLLNFKDEVSKSCTIVRSFLHRPTIFTILKRETEVEVTSLVVKN